MKKSKLLLFIAILAIAFILFPLPPANLYIRITFDEIAGEDCLLYYATDTAGGYTAEQYIASKVDPYTGQVAFCLDSSLEKHLIGLRVDFPDTEDLICIKTITISSAGIIQQEFNPCNFFAEGNIALTNNADITLVKPRNRAYISTGSVDPYIVLSDSLTSQIVECYSHYTLTRILICSLALLGYFYTQRNIFNTK